jgi:hypothetical protein
MQICNFFKTKVERDMNRLNWLKIEKVKIEHVRRGEFCLQYILENRSVQNTFIKNGEFEKSISATRQKKQKPEFFYIPTNLLDHLATTN